MNLYGHHPSSRAGQNFLVNRHTAEKFVDIAAVDPEKVETVVEIGPGLGSITTILCERFRKVVAIEKDKRLIKLWQTQIPKPENLTVIEADACNFDYAHLAKEIGGKLFVFGNLPFNVSTLILERLFHEWQHMAYAQLTFQKEVAERLQAKPSTKDYGSLTIFAQVYCNVKPQMVIQKQQYFPVPKIDSKVLGFEFLAQPRVALEDLKDFEAFTRQLFLYRRKTLLNGARLSKRFAPYHQKLKENLVARGLSETVRVETLDLNTLYELFRSIKPQHPDK